MKENIAQLKSNFSSMEARINSQIQENENLLKDHNFLINNIYRMRQDNEMKNQSILMIIQSLWKKMGDDKIINKNIIPSVPALSNQPYIPIERADYSLSKLETLNSVSKKEPKSMEESLKENKEIVIKENKNNKDYKKIKVGSDIADYDINESKSVDTNFINQSVYNKINTDQKNKINFPMIKKEDIRNLNKNFKTNNENLINKTIIPFRKDSNYSLIPETEYKGNQYSSLQSVDFEVLLLELFKNVQKKNNFKIKDEELLSLILESAFKWIIRKSDMSMSK